MSMEMSVDEYLFKICRACVIATFACFTIYALHLLNRFTRVALLTSKKSPA